MYKISIDLLEDLKKCLKLSSNIKPRKELVLGGRNSGNPNFKLEQESRRLLEILERYGV